MSLDDPTRPCRRHDWQPIPAADDPDGPPATYACARCPATAQACGTCRKPLEHTAARTCPDCVSEARNTVRDIRDLYAQLPDVIAAVAGLHAVRYDRGGGKGHASDTSIIGGAAFVMAMPGNGDKSVLGPREDPMSDVIRTLMAAEQNDPPSVLGILTFWEDTWRTEQHHKASDVTSVRAAAQYLVVHTAWAAQHSPTWQDFRADTREMRGRLRQLTGKIDYPQPSDAPCVECNGTIVQRYTRKGLDDLRECDRCGQTYTPAQYMLAVQQRLETVREDPERLITAAEATTLWRVSTDLLYVWEHRGKIAPAGYDHAGRKVYRNGDVAALKRTRVA